MRWPWVTKDDLRGMQKEISSLTFDLRLAETKIASLRGELLSQEATQKGAWTSFADFRRILYDYFGIEEYTGSRCLVKKGAKPCDEKK